METHRASTQLLRSDENAGALGIWREPAPLGGVAGLDYYPWLVVGIVCIGALSQAGGQSHPR